MFMKTGYLVSNKQIRNFGLSLVLKSATQISKQSAIQARSDPQVTPRIKLKKEN